MFSTFKMLFVYVTLGSITGLLGIPYTLLVRDVSLLYRISMWITAAGVKAAGIKVEITGLDLIPAHRSCIFMSNHVSNLDPPVLIPYLPGRSSVLLKKEIVSIPILGTAMRLAQFVPVERGNRVEAAKASISAASAALRSGLHMMVYPEGTRAKDGRLKPFKKGPFFLAEETQAPIVPIVISGTQHMMRKGSVAITPGIARLQILAPIEPANYKTREAMMAAVQSAMIEALPADMRPLTENS